jgi:hypothetical protein
MDEGRHQAMVRNTRRAAELFDMWRQESRKDISALIHEAEDADKLLDIVCSLLNVGWQLIDAAGHGELDDYLEQLRGASLIAEAMGPADG